MFYIYWYSLYRYDICGYIKCSFVDKHNFLCTIFSYTPIAQSLARDHRFSVDFCVAAARNDLLVEGTADAETNSWRPILNYERAYS